MKQTRTFEGEAVFSRPALRDVFIATCPCGCTFSSRVKAFMSSPGGPDAALGTDCTGCGNTPAVQVEPAARQEAA